MESVRQRVCYNCEQARWLSGRACGRGCVTTVNRLELSVERAAEGVLQHRLDGSVVERTAEDVLQL